MDTPENKATGKAPAGSPLTNRDWRRAPASPSVGAQHGSLDEEDTEGDDGNSDDGKQLVISYLQLFITYLYPSLCRDGAI